MITLTTSEHLDSIAPEWSTLIERVPHSTPLQRPEWLIPWWRQFGSGDIHALAFRFESRLVGFVGMFVHEWLGRRQVTLIGNGITDFLDLLAEPAHAAECARLTFNYLSAHRKLWDVCDWQDLNNDSALMTMIPSELNHRVDEYLPCMRAVLPPITEEYEAALPHGLRRTIRIAARRLEREGELRFETIRNDPDGLVCKELFRLHESRWAPKGGPGACSIRPRLRNF